MNIKKLQLANEFLIEQMNHWLLFPVAMLFSGVTRQFDHNYGGMLLIVWEICSLIPFVFFLIRTKSKSVALFLILHPIAAFIPTLAAMAVIGLANYPEAAGGLLCVGCALLYLIYSATLYLKKGECYTSPISLPVGVGIAVIAASVEVGISDTRAKSWTGYFYFPLVICLGLFFVIMYIRRYLDFLEVNKSSAGYLPASEMFRSGLGLALIYTAVSVSVMALLASLPWMKGVGASLKDALVKFLKWIASLLLKGKDTDSIPTEEMRPNTGPLSGLEKKGPFWLWEVLQYVALAALIILMVIILIKILIRLIQYLEKLIFARMRQPEVMDEDAFDVREKCDLADRTVRRRQKLFGPFSYGERIRRMFQTKVTVSGREKKPEIYTAREWEEKLSTAGMAVIYEKARYSQHEMTAEDVRHMREACRGRKDA